MEACSPVGTVSAPGSAPVAAPFSGALGLTPARPGVYRAELAQAWTVGGGKLHGGFMMALLTRAALTGLDAHTGAPAGTAEPVAVSVDFLRAPDMGPAELATEVIKVGRTASVVRVELHQHGRLALAGTVTAGRLPEGPADWTNLPVLAPEPPAEAVRIADSRQESELTRSCQAVLDTATAAFLRGERADPLMRGWVRPRGEQPDVLFAMLAGDILPPLLFNMGRAGWAPTVQLTALLRGRPAPGWLRLEATSRVIRGNWFDEDYTVIDAQGQLVCQARQLALAPLG